MAQLHTVCRVGELAEGEGMSVIVEQKPIAVFLANGQYYALENRCPHMGSAISDGQITKGSVVCSWHGWRFRLCDGAWADNPCLKIGWYPVRVEGDEVRVDV